jgi:ABC-type amino acid transport substrate-binding protein
MLTSVLENKAAAFVQDIIYAKMASAEHPKKLFIFPNLLNTEELAVGFRKQDEDLRKSFNSFLSSWKKEGGYQNAVDYYIHSTQWQKEL